MSDEELKKVELDVTPEKAPKHPRKNTKWGPRREKVIVDELLTRQIASMLASGSTAYVIAQELDLARTTVARIANSNATRALVKEIGESSVAAAKAQIRMETAGLVKKIMAVIHQQLDEGNLDAVKVGLKVLGFNDQEQIAPGVQTLNVIMPGADQPRTIEVESETSDES